jgi:hypothetical protein
MREVCFLLIVSLLCIAPTVAQSPSATINGIVLDPSGAAIPGAQVVAVNDATGVQYSTNTNAEGVYVVPDLPPGAYRIQVSSSGFKTIIKPDIVIHTQDAIAINFTLPIGATAEVVTVQGGAPLVNTTSAAVSTVIDRQFVENLPLNGRSFNTLLQLTPGVVIAPTGAAIGTSGQFSIAGQRTDSNNFLVDGVSANFGTTPAYRTGQSGLGGQQATSVLGGTSGLVSADDLQEFRIETSSSSAEFGRQPGGQVLITTRSGTNDFHGAIFEYFRNSVFDANDWFANAAGISTAPERHNDFGGVFGGPIWRDKTFFFFSYEGARLRLPQTQVFEVPSISARSSAPSALEPYLSAYPLPNGPTAPGNPDLAEFNGSWSNSATLNAVSLRVDHTFGKRISSFARYNYAPSSLAGRSNVVSSDPSNLVTTESKIQTATAGVNLVLTRKIADAIRVNYSAQTASNVYSLDSFGGATPSDVGSLFAGLPPNQTLAEFGTSDTSFYQEGAYAINRTRQFNLADTISIVHGKSELKFGGDYRSIWLNTKPFQYSLGYVPSSISDFIATGDALVIAQVLRNARIVSRSSSLFGQDTWKMTPQVTLNFGLRWELAPAPHALGSTILTAWTNVTEPTQVAAAPVGTELWKTTYGNFAPRIGAAYKLTSSGDFVVRGGFGVFYDIGSGSAGYLAGAWPNQESKVISGLSLPLSDAASILPQLSTQPPYSGNFLFGFSPDLKLPRSYQWNVALEKSFGGHQVVSATYAGQLGRDLLRFDVNAIPAANTQFAPNSIFTLQDNSAKSNYNALQLQYRAHISHRLQALANYTWSHSLDNASSDAITFAGNTAVALSNLLDRGNSDFDIRNSFSGAFTYSVPSVSSGLKTFAYMTRDWTLDGMVVARSGFPLTVVSAFNEIPGVGISSRANIVQGQPFWTADPEAPGGRLININAFTVPPSGQQGNEGRNVVPGFGLTQVDLSVGRKFPMGERMNWRFRVDAFNVLNHPNFMNPYAILLGSLTTYLRSQEMLNQGLGGLNPLFQQGGPRSLQFSLRLEF